MGLGNQEGEQAGRWIIRDAPSPLEFLDRVQHPEAAPAGRPRTAVAKETLVVQADVEGDAVLVAYDTHGVTRAIDVFEQDYVTLVDST